MGLPLGTHRQAHRLWGDSDRPPPLCEAGLAGGSWSIRGRLCCGRRTSWGRCDLCASRGFLMSFYSFSRVRPSLHRPMLLTYILFLSEELLTFFARQVCWQQFPLSGESIHFILKDTEVKVFLSTLLIFCSTLFLLAWFLKEVGYNFYRTS